MALLLGKRKGRSARAPRPPPRWGRRARPAALACAGTAAASPAPCSPAPTAHATSQHGHNNNSRARTKSTYREVNLPVCRVLHAERHRGIGEVVDRLQRIAGRLQDGHHLGRIRSEGEEWRQQRAEHHQPQRPQPWRKLWPCAPQCCIVHVALCTGRNSSHLT